MNYKFEIKETLSRITNIEADNEEGASNKRSKKQYMSENIVLNAHC